MATPWEQAEALGNSWLGPEHEVLAILTGPPDDPARVALENLGVTYQPLFDRFNHRSPWPPARPKAGIATSPAWHEVMGWAKGHAAAGGRRWMAADVVIAVVWLDHAVAIELERLGASRERILAELAAAGVPIPPGSVPAPNRRGPMTRMAVAPGDVQAVLDQLRREFPPGESGARWGFNRDWRFDDRGYVLAEDGIDLQAIADQLGIEALDYTGPLVPPCGNDIP